MIPAQITDPPETARQLAYVLNMDKEKVYRLITKKELIVRIIPEGRKLSNEKVREIQQLGLSGVVIAEDNGEFLAHVLGFAGVDNQGIVGSN